MNNKIKNLISLIITIIFILSGVFLVYKTNGNVVIYLLDNITNKDNVNKTYHNELDNTINESSPTYNTKTTNDNIIENIDNNEPIINDEISNNPNKSSEAKSNDNTKKTLESNQDNELIFVNISTNSNNNGNLVYRKTYIDPKNPDIMHVIDGNFDKNFFSNSLFVGDSRVDGLKLYSNVPDAHYFCSTGLTEYTLFKNPVVVPNVGNIYFEFLLASNKYDKIYIQMGINRLGTEFKNHVKEYKYAVDKIRELAPNSKIYIVSNMHITNKKSEESIYINNKNIDLFNNEIKKFANNENIFYIDVNKFLDDEETGVLNEEYTKDGVHLLPKYYDIEMDVFYNYSR